MSKIRVYELAHKMGIDNKELIARLHAIGVEVKSHTSVVEEAVAKKLTTPPPVKDESPDEVRVTTTVIRRRARHAIPPEETPPAPEPVMEVSAKPTEIPTPSLEMEKEPEISKVPAEKTEIVETAPAPSIQPKEPEVKESAEEPHHPNRAKILGRVELPIPQTRERSGERRDSSRPPQRVAERGAAPSRGAERNGTPQPVERQGTPRPGERQGAPRAPERPATKVIPEAQVITDDRKKGRKGKEVPSLEEPLKPGKKGMPVPKKKEPYKKTEIAEKHERVFEPGLRAGKGKKRDKYRVQEGKRTEITVPKAIKRIIKISETITVGELAKRMGAKANDLIRALMKMGLMATINHPLDVDAATLLATDFGYEIENVAVDLDLMLEAQPDTEESLVRRSPVVTIMGHVDHGKTSLLDAIREANVIAGEAGGITQHIGAYDVELNGRKITFLDTPGHEAFTAMRARGAKVTDIVILVVAADDGVMPQTREAVNHSKAAGVPIIVAINKIDKPDAKPERVKQELMELGLVSEEWGGDTIFVEVSAKKRTNLSELLEMVLLQADVLDLKANPDKPARGTIVEAKLDRGRGPVATVLVQEGTIKVGDYFVAGVHSGRVRAMQNDRGEKILSAGPSMPAEVIGFTGVPDAGDVFVSLADEKQAKEIATYRHQKIRETELAKSSKLSLEQLYEKIQMGEVKDLNVVVKGDVQGSVEAVSESLRKLTTDAIRLNVIHASVGAITETDVNLATASNAIILGFNVRPEVKAQALAEKEGVDLRLYNIIYDAVDDIKKAMEGLLEPTLKEKHLGRAEIREIFSVPKVGNVAGCYVQDGKMVRNARVRLVRDNVVIFEGKMSSLRRFKEDIKEVASGYECGIGLENYNDLKIGDMIEAFEIEKIAATL
jgi:translation initiation factor IF-2